ncbi:hypothetical protein BDK51DRAFT_37798 [Blyttiomyces helicus]|uniref:Uncharacterized protein n=1 Tax=Blyttiomyces helicus TaxID=388810 RepID=A0A4V1IQR0_9FUNG|nr:hypothetical protein BDK51DRAFT_37798 [Blyttiomyces helicus]|eukprot:RKO87427.1 hypothetical protein BDK51DRAFT_37798 [Blyttiomyces helicus]
MKSCCMKSALILDHITSSSVIPHLLSDGCNRLTSSKDASVKESFKAGSLMVEFSNPALYYILFGPSSPPWTITHPTSDTSFSDVQFFPLSTAVIGIYTSHQRSILITVCIRTVLQHIAHMITYRVSSDLGAPYLLPEGVTKAGGKIPSQALMTALADEYTIQKQGTNSTPQCNMIAKHHCRSADPDNRLSLGKILALLNKIRETPVEQAPFVA